MTLGRLLKHFAEVEPSSQIAGGVEPVVPHLSGQQPGRSEQVLCPQRLIRTAHLTPQAQTLLNRIVELMGLRKLFSLSPIIFQPDYHGRRIIVVKLWL